MTIMDLHLVVDDSLKARKTGVSTGRKFRPLRTRMRLLVYAHSKIFMYFRIRLL